MIQKLGRQVLDIVQWTNNAVELLLEMCPGHTGENPLPNVRKGVFYSRNMTSKMQMVPVKPFYRMCCF